MENKLRLLLRSVYLKGHQDALTKSADMSWEDKIIKDIQQEWIRMLPKKDGYAKGLADKICKLGIWGEDRKILKLCEKDRNFGYNQAISDMHSKIERIK